MLLVVELGDINAQTVILGNSGSGGSGVGTKIDANGVTFHKIGSDGDTILCNVLRIQASIGE